MLYSKRKRDEIGAIIDEFRPDVIHVHNVYPALGPALHLAARQRDVPIVMTVHNMRLRCPNGLMFTEGSHCRRCETGLYVHSVVHRCFPTRGQSVAYATSLWTHRFIMHLERRVSRFIAPSDFMRRRLLEWGIDRESVNLVRHFVELPMEGGVERTIGTYGIFLGRLSPEKGLEVLLRALRLAGDPSFIFVGDGPLRDRLESLAADLELLNTRFVGALGRAQARAMLAEARYLALPSLGEEVAPLAALEALSLGRPLLVSNRGGLPELVAQGGGLACRAGDVVDTHEKLLRLADSDELCRSASQMAFRTAQDALTADRHLGDLEAIYREVSRVGRETSG
jgi:glycosyltransferase involved in cell wall biosynthesis